MQANSQTSPEAGTYSFSEESEKRFQELEGKFPVRTSLVLWALHLVMHDRGFIPADAVEYVAKRVGVSPAWVSGVVSFYSMFKEQPVGKYNLQVCYNLMCWLKGSDQLEKVIKDKLGIEPGQTTPDGKFTFTRQGECIAACGYAPAMQVNEDYHECLTPEKLANLIETLSNDQGALVNSTRLAETV